MSISSSFSLDALEEGPPLVFAATFPFAVVLVFLGIDADEDVEVSTLDRKEYAEVLVRLADNDRTALDVSSSESASGAARFFPFLS